MSSQFIKCCESSKKSRDYCQLLWDPNQFLLKASFDAELLYVASLLRRPPLIPFRPLISFSRVRNDFARMNRKRFLKHFLSLFAFSLLSFRLSHHRCLLQKLYDVRETLVTMMWNRIASHRMASRRSSMAIFKRAMEKRVCLIKNPISPLLKRLVEKENCLFRGHSSRMNWFFFSLHPSINEKIACSWQTSQIICNDCSAEQEKCSKNVFSFYVFTINVKNLFAFTWCR